MGAKSAATERGRLIGSRVASVLSDIFVVKVGVSLKKVLGSKVVRVVRYVDDYLVLVCQN